MFKNLHLLRVLRTTGSEFQNEIVRLKYNFTFNFMWFYNSETLCISHGVKIYLG